jgi:oligopeptide transport system permease protein
LVQRLLGALPILLAVTFATFALIRVIPGGPFDTVNGKPLPPEIRDQFLERYGLDQPIPQQFIVYLSGVLGGDFGVSLGQTLGEPVSEIIGARLPISARLGLFALIFGYAVGIPLGIMAATGRKTWRDGVITAITSIGASIPSIVLAPLLVWLFVRVWGWPGPDPRVWVSPDFLSSQFWSRAIPPILALGIGIAAGVARLVRASLLTTLAEDYLRTARAKGLRERGVIGVHALRNALLPLATVTAPLLAAVLTGTFFIEAVFGVPGLGDTFLTSIADRDYNLLTGVTVLYATLLIMGNVGVDIVYAWLDPRIQYGDSY